MVTFQKLESRWRSDNGHSTPKKTKLLTDCGKMETNLICTTEFSSLKNWHCEVISGGERVHK